MRDDRLSTLTKQEKQEKQGHYSEPFKGIISAFRKFRTGGSLTYEEENSVINFVDQFTTVSLCPDEVGLEVAMIAEEVNKHHHTKTCRPFPKCRFRYPKFPIWKTILVKPYQCEFTEEKEHYLKKYADILKNVEMLLDDTELIEEKNERVQ